MNQFLLSTKILWILLLIGFVSFLWISKPRLPLSGSNKPKYLEYQREPTKWVIVVSIITAGCIFLIVSDALWLQ